MNREEDTSADAAVADLAARYLKYIAHLDMPLSAKIEMIGAFRHLLSNFVDRAFGDDPVQHVHETLARDEKRIPAVVSSDHTTPDDKASLSSAFISPASGRRKKDAHESR